MSETVRLIPSTYDPASAPIHGAEMIWWRVTGSAPRLRVHAMRAVFYRDRVEWEDHPWSKTYMRDREGAPFENEWAVEVPDGKGGFSASGRTTDWHGMGRYSDKMHDTEEQAVAEMREKVEGCRAYHLEEVRTCDKVLGEIGVDVGSRPIKFREAIHKASAGASVHNAGYYVVRSGDGYFAFDRTTLLHHHSRPVAMVLPSMETEVGCPDGMIQAFQIETTKVVEGGEEKEPVPRFTTVFWRQGMEEHFKRDPVDDT